MLIKFLTNCVLIEIFLDRSERKKGRLFDSQKTLRLPSVYREDTRVLLKYIV